MPGEWKLPPDITKIPEPTGPLLAVPTGIVLEAVNKPPYRFTTATPPDPSPFHENEPVFKTPLLTVNVLWPFMTKLPICIVPPPRFNAALEPSKLSTRRLALNEPL